MKTRILLAFVTSGLIAQSDENEPRFRGTIPVQTSGTGFITREAATNRPAKNRAPSSVIILPSKK